MRSVLVILAAASLATGLAACDNPVARQAAVDTRYDPVRADTMLAVHFAPGSGLGSYGQPGEFRSLVASARHAQRDEFVVVYDGSGGTLQRQRAQRVAHSLSHAGARWVSTAVEPAMVTGPDTVVIVRSEYLMANNNCPTHVPSTIGNPNESLMPGFGCADAYNMGQMLARPRDALVGRSPGPADGTVNAAAVQRYREGKVTALNISGTGSSAGGGGGGGGGGSGGAS